MTINICQVRDSEEPEDCNKVKTYNCRSLLCGWLAEDCSIAVPTLPAGEAGQKSIDEDSTLTEHTNTVNRDRRNTFSFFFIIY